MKKLYKALAPGLTVTLTLGSLSLTASASEVPSIADDPADVFEEYAESPIDSTLHIKLPDNFTSHIENHRGYVVNGATGEREELPIEAVDAENDPVSLSYSKKGEDLYVTAYKKYQTFGWIRCAAGTAGSALATGAGAAGKTIVLGPISIGSGILGAVGGGISRRSYFLLGNQEALNDELS